MAQAPVNRTDYKAGANTKVSVNPGGIADRGAIEIFERPTLIIGTVLRSGGGTYDVEVAVPSTNQPVVCTIARSTAATLIGVSECDIPAEGTRCVVFMPSPTSNTGIILNAYPDANRGPLGDVLHTNNNLIDLEGGMSVATEAAYRTPSADPDYVNTIDASAQRYLDLVPGNKAWTNEQGVGISILNLILLLRATDRAKLEFGLLDDMVRLVSGYFQHLSAQGSEQIYNDGGFLTRELGVSIYQWEHSGFLTLGAQAYKEVGDPDTLRKSTSTRYDYADGEATVPRKRMQCFTGYLGDIMNMFVANPDPDVKVDSLSKKVKDQGLMHTHVDASGRLTVRSAAGISFQRNDRIPVPKRLHEAWDPAGDKTEHANGSVPGSKAPYAFPTPQSRSMLMRDANAYRNAQAYSKLHRHSQAAGGKDIYLPEESDMPVPADAYDPSSKGTEPFKANDHKQASFNLEDDGSIVIRDAWGSEIIMRGGNIIISCAGQMELRTGKSLVQMAGHDVITKAKKSVDITATDNDVRIKANVNLQIVSEGRSNAGGGILLESKSLGDESKYTGVKGERVLSRGIVLKAADSRILSTASVVHTAATNQILFDGMDATGRPRASMVIGGMRAFECAVTGSINMQSSGSSGLLIYPQIAVLASTAAVLCGDMSAAVTSGMKFWVPAKQLDMTSNYYDEVDKRFRTAKEMYTDQTAWLGKASPALRNAVKFTYRSSAECGTAKASEVEGATAFYVYQSAWAHMAQTGSSFVPVSLTKWTEYAIEDTYPWPGKETYNAATYVKVKAEAYVNQATGVAKKRQEVLDGAGKPGTIDKVKFNEYEVVSVT